MKLSDGKGDVFVWCCVLVEKLVFDGVWLLVIW